MRVATTSGINERVLACWFGCPERIRHGNRRGGLGKKGMRKQCWEGILRGRQGDVGNEHMLGSQGKPVDCLAVACHCLSTFLCPTSSDQNQSEPFRTNQIPSRHPISTWNLSGSKQFWSDSKWKLSAWIQFDQFQVDSDRNLRLFFKKKTHYLYFYIEYTKII